MYRKGVSVARIARELSVSRPTVYRYVEEIRRWERHPSVQMQLEYMYKDRVCTVIDVDWKNQTVYVENRTDQLPLTAFGVNKTPEWEGLIVTSNYFVLRWGRERCDRKGHAVFLRP